MSQTATRLLTLIQLLQRRPSQKAAELAAALGVSVRTLHRYLEKLDEMGLPLYSERGPYGGFSLVRGYRLPPLLFTPEEAVALALGVGLVEELWGPLYPQAAAGALAKLENVLPDEQRAEVAWARSTLVATGLRRPGLERAAPHLELLGRAAHERHRVSLRHRAGGRAEASWRKVDPYALVQRGGWTYLIGFCHLRQAVRSFRVDRIEEVELLAESFESPPTFDLRAFLADEMAAQAGVEARLRFEPASAAIALTNRLAWEQLTEQPDGSVEVAFRVPDLAWAASTALAYGPAVTVLAPLELRQLVVEWAKEVVIRNEEGNHDQAGS